MDISKEAIDAYKAGNKTILAGNGGSAADAQHIAGEFVSRFYFDRPNYFTLKSIKLLFEKHDLIVVKIFYAKQ